MPPEELRRIVGSFRYLELGSFTILYEAQMTNAQFVFDVKRAAADVSYPLYVVT